MLTLKKLVFVRHVHTYTLLDNPTGQSPGQLSLQIYNTLDISTTTLLNTCKWVSQLLHASVFHIPKPVERFWKTPSAQYTSGVEDFR